MEISKVVSMFLLVSLGILTGAVVLNLWITAPSKYLCLQKILTLLFMTIAKLQL